MLIIKVHSYLTSGQVRDYPEYLMRVWIARFSEVSPSTKPDYLQGTKIAFRDYRPADMIVSESPEQIMEQITARRPVDMQSGIKPDYFR